MKLFTPQQESGGPRYSAKTRIGNWNEDTELDNHRMKEYLYHKETKQLASQITKDKVSSGLQYVPISYSADGLLHYGDHIILLNKQTCGQLSIDISDKIVTTDEAYAVTTSAAKKEPSPEARAVFIIQALENPKEKEGQAVQFGDQFRLVTNPYAYRKALYLFSSPHSSLAASRFSHNQEVTVSTHRSFNTAWEFVNIVPQKRLGTKGNPVPISDPVLIKHCATCQMLSSDSIVHNNNYGKENEVACKLQGSVNKGQQLGNEKIGTITIDETGKAIKDQNQWFIVTSPTPVSAQEFKSPSEVQGDALAEEVRSILLKRGNYGIRGLGRVFRNMDDNGNHKLDLNDFRYGMQDCGIQLSKEEALSLMKRFDRDGDGMVNYDEFLRFLRGEINSARQVWIQKAYNKLDVNKDGTVTLMDIARLYDCSKHPDVMSGRRSKEDVYREFMKQWDTQVADGIVTFSEFLDYYRDVSASIDRDDYFALMMQNAWKI